MIDVQENVIHDTAWMASKSPESSQGSGEPPGSPIPDLR